MQNFTALFNIFQSNALN